jgi:predicted Zn-dependent protease
MRAIIHNSTLSLLVGLVIGDVTGGITVSILTHLAGSAYSRDAEREADQVSVDMMAAAGADPRAINAFFRRIGGEDKGGGFTNLFRSHPVTQERIAAVEKMTAEITGARRPILDSAEWAALKNICKE